MIAWTFTYTEHVDRFLSKLSDDDLAKTRNMFRLFEEYGATLPTKYMKRMSGTKNLWELRAKRVRIFFFIDGNRGIGVHGIVKKSQRTPKSAIDLAIQRARLMCGV